VVEALGWRSRNTDERPLRQENPRVLRQAQPDRRVSLREVPHDRVLLELKMKRLCKEQKLS
jgi:hypothetical protein